MLFLNFNCANLSRQKTEKFLSHSLASQPSYQTHWIFMIFCLLSKLSFGSIHIPIEDILSDLDIRVGTPNKMFEKLGRTPHFPIEGNELRVRTLHKILRLFWFMARTSHITIEGIWSDVQTRMETPHKILRKKDGLRVVGGRWVVSLQENNATLWLHIASWSLPDSQLSLEYKMVPSLAKRAHFELYRCSFN